MTTEIIIGLIGIGLIIFGYFIADIKKYIRERRRGNKGLCIKCGMDDLRELKEGYFCDSCRKPQHKHKVKVWKCPKCSKLNPVDKKTGEGKCRQCGEAYPDQVPSSVE